jgi:hypothetical protein
LESIPFFIFREHEKMIGDIPGNVRESRWENTKADIDIRHCPGVFAEPEGFYPLMFMQKGSKARMT